MEIYLVKNEFGEYKNIKPKSNVDTQLLVDGYGTSLLESWNPIYFVWDIEDGILNRDIFMYLGYIIVANRKVVDALCCDSLLDNVELLPIDIEGEEYYVVNVCSVLHDVIDLKHSKIDYFKDHSIKWIHEYVFKNNITISSLFRIPEISTALFCSKQFINIIKEHRFIGLKFDECKQIRPGFLKSILKI